MHDGVPRSMVEEGIYLPLTGYNDSLRGRRNIRPSVSKIGNNDYIPLEIYLGNCGKLRPFQVFYPPPHGVDRNIVAHHPYVY